MYIRRHVAFDVMTSSFISKIKAEKPPLNAARIHVLCFDASSCSNYLFSLSLSLFGEACWTASPDHGQQGLSFLPQLIAV